MRLLLELVSNLSVTKLPIFHSEGSNLTVKRLPIRISTQLSSKTYFVNYTLFQNFAIVVWRWFLLFCKWIGEQVRINATIILRFSPIQCTGLCGVLLEERQNEIELSWQGLGQGYGGPDVFCGTWLGCAYLLKNWNPNSEVVPLSTCIWIKAGCWCGHYASGITIKQSFNHTDRGKKWSNNDKSVSISFTCISSPNPTK